MVINEGIFRTIDRMEYKRTHKNQQKPASIKPISWSDFSEEKRIQRDIEAIEEWTKKRYPGKSIEEINKIAIEEERIRGLENDVGLVISKYESLTGEKVRPLKSWDFKTTEEYREALIKQRDDLQAKINEKQSTYAENQPQDPPQGQNKSPGIIGKAVNFFKNLFA